MDRDEKPRGEKEGPKVWVFFYGSFINPSVLAKGGFVPAQVKRARVSGYDILIETLATLVRSQHFCVYGIVCEATHSEIRKLYGQDWLGGTYLPEAVLVETDDHQLISALCYIAHTRPPSRPAGDYLDWIIEPARDYGFPGWYLQRLESFRNWPEHDLTSQSLS